MRFNSRLSCLAALAVVLLGSCAKESTESYSKYEGMALEAYMTQKYPDLVGNNQIAEDGKDSYTYYVDILDAGDPDAEPLNSDNFWVNFDFSGRDLAGNIIMTRRANEAKQMDTFTKYTHYVPYYRYCGDENTNLMEGMWVAMRNELHLSDYYYNKYKDDPSRRLTSQDVLLRNGSKVVLYLPSSIVGSVSGDGGYQGQYSLSSSRPYIVTMTITNNILNPIELEGEEVDNYCSYNGDVLIYHKADAETGTPAVECPEDVDDPLHPYSSPERWVSACDTIPQVYVNFRYDPSETLTFPTDSVYFCGYEPYTNSASMQSINDRVAAALQKRFQSDEAYVGVKALDADSVKLDGAAKIWYIGRFIDGFIFDTNIDEVKEIIYGEVTTLGTSLSYTPSSGGMIQAFYYAIPNMKFGQWAAIITTSSYAYGASGKAGGTSTSSSSSYSSSYMDYLNYMSYNNSYYGNSGYGGYYNGYYGGYGGYGGYNNGYYGGYGSGYDTSSSASTTTTTTVSTEILPYTPLIFQIYIEPGV